MAPKPSLSSTTHQGSFPETAWAEISALRRGSDDSHLHNLARAYWRPLYFFLRRTGHSHEDASDHVQGFFLHILSTSFFATVEREGAKFRSYLLASLRHWLARRYTYETAQKRGGLVPHVPLDELNALEHAPDLREPYDAEVVYDRRWARELIARCIALLRHDYTERDQEAAFETFKGALPGGVGLPPYPELAATLHTSEATARKAVFNLRHKFSEVVRREIRATVQTQEDAEEEFEHLFRVLNQKGFVPNEN